MASDQARRENNAREREIHVERDRVPKMTSHFEALAEKSREPEAAAATGKDAAGSEPGPPGQHAQFESLADKVRVGAVSDEENERGWREQQKQGKMSQDVESGGGEKQERPSLEDIANYRAMAQQNSAEAIRAAEERYHQAQQRLVGGMGFEEARNADKGVHAGRGGQQASEFGDGKGEHARRTATDKGRERGSSVAGKGQQARGTAMERSEEVKDTARGGKVQQAREAAMESGPPVIETATEKGEQATDAAVNGAQRASGYASQKGNEAKDAALEKSQQARESIAEGTQRASELAREKGAAARDTTPEKGQYTKDAATQRAKSASEIAAEKGAIAKDTVVQKGQVIKESLMSTGKKAKDQIASAAGQGKDYTVAKAGEARDVTKKVAQYAGEKAAVAKDKAVDGGKGAGHYAGVVAEKAAAVGWTAAHYTTEKAIQGTKVVAGAVEGAVGTVGHKAAEIGSKAAGAAKTKASAAAETVVDYTARKKDEANKGDEEDRSVVETQALEKGGLEKEGEQPAVFRGHGKEKVKEAREGGRGKEEQRSMMLGEAKREWVREGGERMDEAAEGMEGGGAGGVLEAIGETISEIAQATKSILIGQREEEIGYEGARESEREGFRQEHGETK